MSRTGSNIPAMTVPITNPRNRADSIARSLRVIGGGKGLFIGMASRTVRKCGYGAVPRQRIPHASDGIRNRGHANCTSLIPRLLWRMLPEHLRRLQLCQQHTSQVRPSLWPHISAATPHPALANLPAMSRIQFEGAPADCESAVCMNRSVRTHRNGTPREAHDWNQHGRMCIPCGQIVQPKSRPPVSLVALTRIQSVRNSNRQTANQQPAASAFHARSAVCSLAGPEAAQASPDLSAVAWAVFCLPYCSSLCSRLLVSLRAALTLITQACAAAARPFCHSVWLLRFSSYWWTTRQPVRRDVQGLQRAGSSPLAGHPCAQRGFLAGQQLVDGWRHTWRGLTVQRARQAREYACSQIVVGLIPCGSASLRHASVGGVSSNCAGHIEGHYGAVRVRHIEIITQSGMGSKGKATTREDC